MWEVSPLFSKQKAAVGVGSSFAFRGEERRGSCRRTAVGVGSVSAFREGESRGKCGKLEVPSRPAEKNAAVVVEEPR